MKRKGFFTHFLELNLALLLISTSGVLGRYIDLPVPIIIFLRSFIGGLVLFLYCRINKISLKVKSNDRNKILLGGLFLGLHWVTYFYALKLSNVAVGMLSLFTFPAITAILEPLFLKTKFQPIHLLLAGMVLVGIFFLTPTVDFNNSYFKAILFGVFSALCYAIRNIMLKKEVSRYHQSSLMFNQLMVVSLLLLPGLTFLDVSNVTLYLPTVIILAVLTTALGHTLFVYSLNNFSTISASLMSSLQPVYGILFAVLLLQEYPETKTIIGGFIIVLTVVVESFRASHQNKS